MSCGLRSPSARSRLPSSPPLDQQRGQESGLQGNNHRNRGNGIAMLLPQTRFVEQDGSCRAGDWIASGPTRSMALESTRKDLFGINSRGERCRISAGGHRKHQVGRSSAVRVEGLDKSAHDSVADIDVVRRIDRGGRYAGDLAWRLPLERISFRAKSEENVKKTTIESRGIFETSSLSASKESPNR